MSVEETYKCDGLNCEQVRKETNHWFRVTETADEWTKNISPSLTIRPWRGMSGNSDKHFCGQACVQKFVEQWMNKQLK